MDCKTTVAEVEARYPGHANRPFGRFRRHWEGLKAAMQPGDEIYLFHSTPEFSGFLAWQRGYVLVRDGKVIRRVLTYELRPFLWLLVALLLVLPVAAVFEADAPPLQGVNFGLRP